MHEILEPIAAWLLMVAVFAAVIVSMWLVPWVGTAIICGVAGYGLAAIWRAWGRIDREAQSRESRVKR